MWNLWWSGSVVALALAAAALLISTRLPVGEEGQRRREESRLLREGRGLWRSRASRPGLAGRLSLRLRQSGHVGAKAQLAVLLAWAVVMVGAAMLGGLLAIMGGRPVAGIVVMSALWGGFAAGLGWLALERKRRRRTLRLDEDIELVLQVTRMLWDTGMTLESLLHRLIQQLGATTPDMVLELRIAANRIDSGQDREKVLEELAAVQASEGVEQFFLMFAQMARTGGRARDSLTTLVERLGAQRRTRLQQRVSQLSGTMSLVMMLCLFPALLIVMAGPALVNLSGLMGSLGGP
ncbi:MULTISPECIES: type II secretion system F family protein [Halomonas]|uniref:type II secretion system F family protein n=1 Tax=Halomonas TaxID=2745 RepID=UPI001A8F6F0F|nr:MULTISPECIES: type II secretion system F family protein [Halomonas]MED5296200.1 type II secretion system F family protein [Pseudomonadota bacterium]MBN8411985.1 type II secretion system F family protein [Halomonas litopenaei]MBY5926368.1 type II secretion system F family protein [Halomonas sp. DP4Y7-2]MBY5970000.1 type II secretion system F family protein [Halomonas denitrificans]MBY6209781.1 type II secretion system F family protein [Halomonas sp. DP3Y7-2]